MKFAGAKGSKGKRVNTGLLADRLGITIHQSVIEKPFSKLRLCRLADADLLLSKMMRYDPADFDDLVFVVERSEFGPDAVADIVEQARIPECEEI